MAQTEKLAKVALWKSREESKTDYNGKVQWKNTETGEFDQEQVCFFEKEENAYEQKELVGSICDKNEDGTLVFFCGLTLRPTDSDNERAPLLSGIMSHRDNESGKYRKYNVALWHNDSDNERAPVLTGNISSIEEN